MGPQWPEMFHQGKKGLLKIQVLFTFRKAKFLPILLISKCTYGIRRRKTIPLPDIPAVEAEENKPLINDKLDPQGGWTARITGNNLKCNWALKMYLD